MKAFDRWRGRQSTRAEEPPLPATGPVGDVAQVRVAHLATVHSTYLAVKGRSLDQTRKAGGRAHLLWTPGEELGFLVGDDLGRDFGLGGSTPRAPAHLVRLAQASESTVMIADLWTRTWLSPAPVDGVERGAVRLRAGVTTAGPEERLALEQRGTADTDPQWSRAATAYARLIRTVGAGVHAHDVLAALREPDPALARLLFSALLSLLPRDDLQQVALEILGDDELATTLTQVFPSDAWAARALPALRTWLRDRDAPWTTTEVGTDLDVLWPTGIGDVAASPGETVTFAARATVRPRRRVCIVATARNEGVYLLEWLAYYRALGVDEFFVYSNNNEDGSDLLLRALADAGTIHWLDSTVAPGTKAQAKAYAHAYSMLPDVLDFTWSMTIDIDEFLVLDPERFTGLPDFLDWHATRQTDVISVNWVVVGPGELTHWSDDLVTRRFPASVATVNNHIKSISRPGRVLGSQPHFPYTTERERLAFREATGAPHTWFTSTLAPHLVKAQSDEPTTGHAALHHYALKSAEEFLWKFSRNRGGRLTAAGETGMALTLEERFLQRFLAQYGADAGDVRPAIEATVPHLEQRIDELRRLPGVADAERQVKELFVERSAQVLGAYRPLLENEFGESGRRLLQILDDPIHHPDREGSAHAARPS